MAKRMALSALKGIAVIILAAAIALSFEGDSDEQKAEQPAAERR